MDKHIKVLYMGGNRAGVEILTDLLNWNVGIEAVVVRASDSGVDTWTPSLKKVAMEKGLKVFQPKNPNSQESIKFYQALNFDYIISVQYDRILKDSVMSLAKKDSINLHFAPLPKYRGCYPIPWAIIDGNHAGVSLHWMEVGIDTGNIICTRKIPCSIYKTAKEIYETATTLGREIFREMVPKIFDGEVISFPQVESESSYFPQGEPYDRTIDWSWMAEKICRFIRAFTFPPFASARTYYKSFEIEILHPVYIGRENLSDDCRDGTVIDITEDRILRIQCGDGVLEAPHFRFKQADNTYIDSDIEVIKLTGLKVGSVLGLNYV